MYSKSRVIKAGSKLRHSSENKDDISVINAWRSDYSYILKSFSGVLFRGIKKLKKNNIIKDEPTQGQRLKRFETIKDKIQNRQSEMCLTRMNDIAGCRVIFDSMSDLVAFKDNFDSGIHNLIYVDDKLQNPESTGYRGIHCIYKYKSKSKKYDNKRLEVQLRTKYQHYWATAVEIYDIINGQRVKFSTGVNASLSEQYFQYASEIISRSQEGMFSCFPSLSNAEVIEKFESIDNETNITRQLLNIGIIDSISQRIEKEKGVGVYNIVIKVSTKDENIEIFSSVKEKLVLEQYFEWERDYPEDIPVYVLGLKKAHIQECFRNYFYDSTGFTNSLIDGIEALKTQKGFGEEKTRKFRLLEHLRVWLKVFPDKSPIE
tara:strand:- start:1150 stop:2271 length:1122 start_codon:yes stop_codon:yes gene_type:complete